MNEIGGWRVKIPSAYYLGFYCSTHAITVARLASLVELRLLTLSVYKYPSLYHTSLEYVHTVSKILESY